MSVHKLLIPCLTLLLTSDALSDPGQEKEREIPDGFEERELEPTGGRIVMPKDWFLNANHRKNALMWTVSKEDTRDDTKTYDTGFRIQLFFSVEENTSRKPEEHAREYFASRLKASKKVHKEFPLMDQGTFKRIGVDVEEGRFRIVYSMFWSEDLDMMIITTAGSPVDQWDDHADTLQRLNEFEPFNLEKIREAAEKEKSGATESAPTSPKEKADSKNPKQQSDS